VRALILAAERPAAVGRTYFVAGHGAVTWRELYEEVARAASSRPIQLQVPLPAVRIAAHAGDLVSSLTGRATMLNKNKAALARARWWLCDSGAARQDLGWQAEIGLQAGVRDVYLWYVQAGWLKSPRSAAPAAPPRESKE
jgi:nucleoside-diphosphate-sugar epimerase